MFALIIKSIKQNILKLKITLIRMFRRRWKIYIDGAINWIDIIIKLFWLSFECNYLFILKSYYMMNIV